MVFLGSIISAGKLGKFHLKVGENVSENGHRNSGCISKFICTSAPVVEVFVLLEVFLSAIKSFYIQANRLAAKGKYFRGR